MYAEAPLSLLLWFEKSAVSFGWLLYLCGLVSSVLCFRYKVFCSSFSVPPVYVFDLVLSILCFLIVVLFQDCPSNVALPILEISLMLSQCCAVPYCPSNVALPILTSKSKAATRMLSHCCALPRLSLHCSPSYPQI